MNFLAKSILNKWQLDAKIAVGAGTRYSCTSPMQVNVVSRRFSMGFLRQAMEGMDSVS